MEKDAEIKQAFTLNPDYLLVTLQGAGTMSSLQRAYRELALYCVQHQCKNVLVEVEEVDGNPKMIESFELGNILTELGLSPNTKIAILLTAPNPDQRFIETFMLNQGYAIRFFQERSRAVEWLKGDA